MEVDKEIIFSPTGCNNIELLYYSNILWQPNRPPKILSDFISKLVGNECKGALTSKQPSPVK
jgi:hypothetical protein